MLFASEGVARSELQISKHMQMPCQSYMYNLLVVV